MSFACAATTGVLTLSVPQGPRGIYSGCLGYFSLSGALRSLAAWLILCALWLGRAGAADFNVVIRTAVCSSSGEHSSSTLLRGSHAL